MGFGQVVGGSGCGAAAAAAANIILAEQQGSDWGEGMAGMVLKLLGALQLLGRRHLGRVTMHGCGCEDWCRQQAQLLTIWDSSVVMSAGAAGVG